MATVRYEPIDKEVSFRFKDGRKGNGKIWSVRIDVSALDTTHEYGVVYQMFGNECSVRCDEQFHEIE